MWLSRPSGTTSASSFANTLTFSGLRRVVFELQGLLHPPRMLRRRQDALLQIRLPTRPGEAAGETDLLEIVHLEPQERIGRLDLGGVHGAAAERG